MRSWQKRTGRGITDLTIAVDNQIAVQNLTRSQRTRDTDLRSERAARIYVRISGEEAAVVR
jgi:hypothetical protein